MVADARVTRLLDGFERSPGVAPEAAHTVRAVVGRCPSIRDALGAAVGSGALSGLELIGADERAGATYDRSRGVIALPPTALRPALRHEAAFVLGHEARHAANAPVTEQLDLLFARAVDARARASAHGDAPVRDYADLLDGLVTAHVTDEAEANLAGWNAFVEAVREDRGRLSLRDLVRLPRARDVVQASPATVAFRPGYRPHADFTLPVTTANVATMIREYVDAPPHVSALGRRGRSDYRNYYAAAALGLVARLHRDAAPRSPGRPEEPIGIDLATHGLDLDQLHGNGIDLGRDRAPLPFVDVGTGRNAGRRGVIRHTADDAVDGRPGADEVEIEVADAVERRTMAAGVTATSKPPRAARSAVGPAAPPARRAGGSADRRSGRALGR